MVDKRVPSKLEERLTREIFAKVEGKEPFDATKAMLQRYQQWMAENAVEVKQRQERHEREGQQLKWLARIAAIPVAILFCLYVWMIAYGLVQGQIHEISKSSHRLVSIDQTPVQFWITVIYHSGVAAFLGFISYRCWQGTRWFQKTADNQANKEEMGAAIRGAAKMEATDARLYSTLEEVREQNQRIVEETRAMTRKRRGDLPAWVVVLVLVGFMVMLALIALKHHM